MTKKEAIQLVKQDAFALENLDDIFKNDREIVMAAVSINGNTLKYASEALKNDRELVLEAVKKDASALEHASYELKTDKDFIISIMAFNNDALKYVPSQLREELQIKESIVTSFEIINNDKIDVRFFESNEHKLQVAFKDLENKMTWDEANSACVKLGEGWRLPRLKELQIMSRELYECNIGNFQSRYLSENSPAYWSIDPSIKQVYGGAVVSQLD